jgi:peptidoglycan/xylan/chitin deacetylase (PgdA/CDA1 family)
MVPFRGRHAGTRVVVGGAVLVSLYVSLAAACLPGYLPAWPSTGAVGVQPGVTASSRPSIGLVLATQGHYAPRPTASRTDAPAPAVSAMPSGVDCTGRRAGKPTPRPATQPSRPYHVPILMYHRIVPASEAGNSLSGLVVPPEVFARQMRAFHDAGWHSITMATLAKAMEADTAIPLRTFVITFDDGWADGYHYAYQILRQYGFVGTFFVIGSRIGEKDFLSSEQLRLLEAGGNDIGNHTENHVRLGPLPAARATREVENASREICAATGHRPAALSFPMGSTSTSAVTAVGETPDLKVAVTTAAGQTLRWSDRFNLPRLRVSSDTSWAQLVDWLGQSQR